MSNPQKGISLFDSFGTATQFQAASHGFHLAVLTAAEAIAGAALPGYVLTVGGLETGTNTLKSITLTAEGALITIDEDAESAFQTLLFSASTGATSVSLAPSVVRKPLLSIQVKSSVSTIIHLLRKISLMGDGSRFFYEIIKNGTLTGASFTSVNPASDMNFDTSATAVSLGATGMVVDSGYVGFDYLVTLYELNVGVTAGIPDIITITVTSMGTRAVPVNASFRWTERAAI